VPCGRLDMNTHHGGAAREALWPKTKFVETILQEHLQLSCFGVGVVCAERTQNRLLGKKSSRFDCRG